MLAQLDTYAHQIAPHANPSTVAFDAPYDTISAPGIDEPANLADWMSALELTRGIESLAGSEDTSALSEWREDFRGLFKVFSSDIDHEELACQRTFPSKTEAK